jgi:hypothetical protein
MGTADGGIGTDGSQPPGDDRIGTDWSRPTPENDGIRTEACHAPVFWNSLQYEEEDVSYDTKG